MRNVLLFVKLFVVITGLALGLNLCVERAGASEVMPGYLFQVPAPTITMTFTGAPPPSAAPTAASSIVFVTIHGIACIDRNVNGACGGDEARVPNVIVRNSDGIAAVSDNRGEFSIQAASYSGLDITIPTGYKSVNGNMRAYRIQMADTRNTALGSISIDIALLVDSTNGNAGGDQAGANIGAYDNNGQTTSDNLPFSVNNNVIRVALIGIGLIAMAAIFVVLRIIQRVYQRSANQQEIARQDQHTKDIAACLENPAGWRLVAGQIAADVLHKAVSIDEGAGILNAIAEPSPRFSVVTFDRQEIMFTTNPGFIRRARLIRGGDRILDVTARSTMSHASLRMLWQHVCATRGMLHVTPPDSAHWYIVVRFADNRPVNRRQHNHSKPIVMIRAKTQPYLQYPKRYKPWRGSA